MAERSPIRGPFEAGFLVSVSSGLISAAHVSTCRGSGGSGWGGVLDPEVVRQREFDLYELISGDVVHWVAIDVVDIDRANLVDQQPRRPARDLKLRAVDGRTGRRGGGDHGDH